MKRYTVTVTVELPEGMEEGPLGVLAATILDALNASDIDVVHCAVETGDSR